MQFGRLRRALGSAYRDIVRHHTLQAAAALSYYSVLAIFPALILLSAFMGTIPLPNLFGRVLDLMSSLLPADSMRVVQSVLLSALVSKHGAWISIGTLGLLWVTSAAFDALIEALDIAYDVDDPRPLWKTRLLALALGLISCVFLTLALAVMILGPRFGDWLATRLDLPRMFVLLWPALHWGIAIASTVLTVEIIYFLAPNVKQRFSATLPGAIVSVASWLLLSYLLGIYFRHFGNYDRIYGTLGGFVVFMVWLYWTSIALLFGAELNAELAKQSAKGAVQQKGSRPTALPVDRAA